MTREASALGETANQQRHSEETLKPGGGHYLSPYSKAPREDGSVNWRARHDKATAAVNASGLATGSGRRRAYVSAARQATFQASNSRQPAGTQKWRVAAAAATTTTNQSWRCRGSTLCASSMCRTTAACPRRNGQTGMGAYLYLELSVAASISRQAASQKSSQS